MQDACAYMEIICWGTVFVFGYHSVCSVMKGLGDSKSPLYFVAVAAAVNIILDLLLVSYLVIGTRGLRDSFFPGYFTCNRSHSSETQELCL